MNRNPYLGFGAFGLNPFFGAGPSMISPPDPRYLGNGYSPAHAALAALAMQPNGQQQALQAAQVLGAQGLTPAQIATFFPNVPSAVLAQSAQGTDVGYGLSTGATTIPAAGTATVSTTPQKRHLVKRLWVTSTVATNFTISAWEVGVENILATTGQMSMAVFIEDATSPTFKSIVCEVGHEVSVTVTNVSGGALTFTASVTGTELPPGCSPGC